MRSRIITSNSSHIGSFSFWFILPLPGLIGRVDTLFVRELIVQNGTFFSSGLIGTDDTLDRTPVLIRLYGALEAVWFYSLT